MQAELVRDEQSITERKQQKSKDGEPAPMMPAFVALARSKWRMRVYVRVVCVRVRALAISAASFYLLACTYV